MLQIISALEDDHKHKVSIEETWQSSTCQFVQGIARNYYGFEDITIPILSCVYQIKHGFRLMLLNRKKCLFSESQGSEVSVLLDNLMSLPSHRSIVNVPFEKLSGRSKIDVLHALLNHLILVNFKSPNKKIFEEFDAIFREYVNVWQVCSAERERKMEKFKYFISLKTKNSTRVLWMKRASRIFPKNISSDSDADGSVDITEQPESTSGALVDISEDDLEYICDKYYQIYSENKFNTPYHKNFQREGIILGARAAGQISKYMGQNLSFTPKKLSLGSLCNVALQVNSLKKVSDSNRTSTGFMKLEEKENGVSFQSFHFGFDVAEASEAVPVVNNLLTKVHELLQRWPGNHILFEIVKAADHVLRMSAKSSIYQILVNVETLSRKSQAWEQVSSKSIALQIN